MDQFEPQYLEAQKTEASAPTESKNALELEQEINSFLSEYEEAEKSKRELKVRLGQLTKDYRQKEEAFSRQANIHNRWKLQQLQKIQVVREKLEKLKY